MKRADAFAYHEAGHAVVACLWGIPFRRVALTAPSEQVRDQFGYVVAGMLELSVHIPDWVYPWSFQYERKPARQYIAQNISMTLAGPLAESIRTRCWQQQTVEEGGGDEALALSAATLTDRDLRPTKPVRQWVNRVRFLTLQLLMDARVWDAVDKVAQALLRHSNLTGKAVRAIVGAVLPCQPADTYDECATMETRFRRVRDCEKGLHRWNSR